MSIYDYLSKSKGLLWEMRNRVEGQYFVAILLILVALTGFALGRMSLIEENNIPIKMYQENALINAESLTGNAIQAGTVIASKNGTKYYFPWCSGANRITEANKVIFPSIEKAKEAGLTPASNCKGLK